MKHLKTFENLAYSDLEYNLSILESYIIILNNHYKKNNSGNDNINFAARFFIVLHNMLIIENLFYNDVVKNNKELNKHLDIDMTYDVTDIYDIFLELYDVNNRIRNNVETIDSISVIRKTISEIPTFYTELMSEKDIEILKIKVDSNKYNI